jgi:glycosyltransferase involved in cell wall biosynthesis
VTPAHDPTVGAFVVTWNRADELRETIQILQHQTWPPDAIFVVDNGDGESARHVAEEVGVEYRHTGGNLGPAGGVAFGMRWLAALGFDWIHIGDDDDPMRSNDDLKCLRLLIRRHADDPTVGAVALSGFQWDWRRGRPARIPSTQLHGDVVVHTTVANQHPIVRREVVEAVGTFHDDLFFGIDDVTFFLRMSARGWRVLVDGDRWIDRLREQARPDVRPPGRVRRHRQRASNWREYYDTRNYIAEMRRTFRRPDLARWEAARVLGRCAAAWAGGPRYGAAVTRLQLRAVADGYRGRLGMTVPPVPKD